MTTLAGRFEPRRRLRASRFFEAWEGWDHALERRVFLKIAVRPEDDVDRAVIAAHVDLWKRLMRLGPADVPAVDHIGVDDAATWAAMAWIDLPDLAEIAAAAAIPVGWRDAFLETALARALAALANLHAGGLLHGDLSPANLLLAPDPEVERVWLIDPAPPLDLTDPDDPRRRLILASPRHVAPEVLAGAPLSPAADLWSLGRLFEDLAVHLGVDPPAILRETTHPDPDRRPPSAAATLSRMSERNARAPDPAPVPMPYEDLIRSELGLRRRADSDAAPFDGGSSEAFPWGTDAQFDSPARPSPPVWAQGREMLRPPQSLPDAVADGWVVPTTTGVPPPPAPPLPPTAPIEGPTMARRRSETAYDGPALAPAPSSGASRGGLFARMKGFFGRIADPSDDVPPPAARNRPAPSRPPSAAERRDTAATVVLSTPAVAPIDPGLVQPAPTAEAVPAPTAAPAEVSRLIAVPIAPVPRGPTTKADFSVFAPGSVAPGRTFFVEVWVAASDDRDEMTERATASGRLVERGDRNLVDLERDVVITVVLTLPDFEVIDPISTLGWDGSIRNVGFLVKAPEDLSPGLHPGLVKLMRGGVPFATIAFDVEVALAAPEVAMEAARHAEMRRIRRAFASYAGPDRAEVLRRVQGIEATGMRVFLDIVRLRSGDAWEPVLFREIEASDGFFLFWSRAAAASPWVEREWRHALDRRGLDFIDPLPLEDPRLAPPPPELAAKHFNDMMLIHLAAERALAAEAAQGGAL
jgi:hypothetical protein